MQAFHRTTSMRTPVRAALATTGLITGLMLSGLAQAHEGHGMPGASHWHAEEVWLLVGAVAVGLAAWAWNRRR